MLSTARLVARDGVEIDDVACRHEHGRGHEGEHVDGHFLVLVRRGCFVRSVGGVDTLLDPTLAYCMNPGQEQRYDHPYPGGDDCTAVRLAGPLTASLWGGEPLLPTGPLPTSPEIDLGHRLLVAGARRGADADELAERAIALVADVLERTNRERVASGRPAGALARRTLVDGAREALAARPDTTLTELARVLSVSPHHLSRAFRAATGHTIARHRMRLRVRAALERLAGGERDLARLAADLGFVDHSHLCRVVRSETGETPSGLRQALSPPS
jgi:AraC-like DNA-binding protein